MNIVEKHDTHKRKPFFGFQNYYTVNTKYILINQPHEHNKHPWSLAVEIQLAEGHQWIVWTRTVVDHHL